MAALWGSSGAGSARKLRVPALWGSSGAGSARKLRVPALWGSSGAGSARKLRVPALWGSSGAGSAGITCVCMISHVIACKETTGIGAPDMRRHVYTQYCRILGTGRNFLEHRTGSRTGRNAEKHT